MRLVQLSRIQRKTLMCYKWLCLILWNWRTLWQKVLLARHQSRLEIGVKAGEQHSRGTECPTVFFFSKTDVSALWDKAAIHTGMCRTQVEHRSAGDAISVLRMLFFLALREVKHLIIHIYIYHDTFQGYVSQSLLYNSRLQRILFQEHSPETLVKWGDAISTFEMKYFGD